MPGVRLILGDCLEILPTLEADSVDAVVTDPPAGIAFMGKAWDRSDRMTDVLPAALSECLRVARPGARLLCWALPRTSHWTGLAIESAGWQIEDVITHHFGTGFPKHKSKLKPATEFWFLATKPGGAKWLGVDACRIPANGDSLDRGLGNVRPEGWDRPWMHDLEMVEKRARRQAVNVAKAESLGRWPPNLCLSHCPDCTESACGEGCPVRLLGEQSGESKSGDRKAGNYGRLGGQGRLNKWSPGPMPEIVGDSGTAARFFPCFDHDPFIYAAKASRRDRNEGCEGLEARIKGQESIIERVREPDREIIAAYLKSSRERLGLSMAEIDDRLGTNTLYSWFEGRKAGIELPTPERWLKLKEILGFDDTFDAVMTETRVLGAEERILRSTAQNPRLVARLHGRDKPSLNVHPTVKSVHLMRWLCRLACPKGGTILDPFMGSGSTGKAAVSAGFTFLGIEQDRDYFAIAEKRIAAELDRVRPGDLAVAR